MRGQDKKMEKRIFSDFCLNYYRDLPLVRCQGQNPGGGDKMQEAME